jgi:hypothetical protein
MLAGESVLSLVAQTGVPEQTLHRWKTQGRVDAGLAEGVTSTESQWPAPCFRSGLIGSQSGVVQVQVSAYSVGVL